MSDEDVEDVVEDMVEEMEEEAEEEEWCCQREFQAVTLFITVVVYNGS